MHEFSIAMNIIEIAETSALQHEATGVLEVEIEVGDFSGVNTEALEFAWESAVDSSLLLKNSKLIIHPVSLLLQCNNCHHCYAQANLFESCPSCGEFSTTIIRGRELKVKSVTLAEP
ncbi:MAG: hydrogenase maturation nickel metallochaperone HypA [Bacteroidales bacterium]|nr:hydrogenase maturation nickel metallochaperone HypA [Bacteroidales bacterium]